MGKTPEKLRLVIHVDDKWINRPEIVELAKKGHHVYVIGDPLATEPHLILSRHAHSWDDSMWPLLDITMKAARKRKKGQESEPDKD